MEDDRIIKAVWPDWDVEKTLDHDTWGSLFQVVKKREHGPEKRAAVRVISIPQNESEVSILRAEGLSEENIRSYFYGMVRNIVRKYKLMQSLEASQCFISVEDYKALEKRNEFGWVIAARMTLMPSLEKYSSGKTFTEAEVLKIGLDILSALELCEQKNIVHLNVDPSYIYVDRSGKYRLGEFDLTAGSENTGAYYFNGAQNYIAPEVERGAVYDRRADLYSLGMILYRLMNRKRMPFQKSAASGAGPLEREAANRRRLDGEEFPAPYDASRQMAKVIMRACAFEPEARFASASAMKQALLDVQNGSYVDEEDDLDKTVSVRKLSPERNTPGPANGRGSMDHAYPVNGPGSMNIEDRWAGQDLDATISVRGAQPGQPYETDAQSMAQKAMYQPEPRKAVGSFNTSRRSRILITIGIVLATLLLLGGGILIGAKLLNHTEDKAGTEAEEVKDPDDADEDDETPEDTEDAEGRDE